MAEIGEKGMFQDVTVNIETLDTQNVFTDMKLIREN